MRFDPADKRIQQLRDRAEDALRGRSQELKGLLREDIERLVEELQIHQIELELQNEELRVVQQQLELSRQEYSDLYENAPVGYLTADRWGLIRRANHTLGALLRVNPGQLAGAPLVNFVHAADRPGYHRQYEQLVRGEGAMFFEAHLARTEEGYFLARLIGSPVYDADEQLVECRITVNDLTEVMRTQRALGESEARYRLLANSVHDVILQITATGAIAFATPSVRTLLGFDPDALIGRPALDYVFGEDRERVRAVLAEVPAGGRAAQVEFRMRRKAGDALWMEASIKRLAVPEEHTDMVAVLRDTTKRRKAEDTLRRLNAELDRRVSERTQELEAANRALRDKVEALVRSEEAKDEAQRELLLKNHLLANISEMAQAAVLIVDTEGRITFANQRARELFALREESLVSRTYTELPVRFLDASGQPIEPEQLPHAQVARHKTPSYGLNLGIEVAPGKVCCCSVNAAPIFERDEEVTSVVLFLAGEFSPAPA